MDMEKQIDSQRRFMEIQEENELLIAQLHQVQDELERRVLDIKSSGHRKSSPLHLVEDELPETVAEMHRLKAILDAQGMVYMHEGQNALNVRLGNLLIKGVESKGGVLSLPNKLVKIWRETNQKNPPETLGGKSFDKIIAAYQDGEWRQ